MIFSHVGKMIIYRLWLLIILGIQIQHLPQVFSGSVSVLNRSSNKTIDFINLQPDSALKISSNNGIVQTSLHSNILLSDPIIEYMSILPPLQTVPIMISEVPKYISYIVVQLHTYVHKVTLGYKSNKSDPHSYVSGTNIGLVNITDSNGFNGNITYFIENPNNFSVITLVAVLGYQKTAPIPGGCNMEFDTEIAPYLHLNYTDSLITLTNQPAAMSQSSKIGCQIPPGALTRYDVYRLYLPEQDFTESTYFASIKSMLTVDRIKQYGTKVVPSLTGQMNRRLFSSYKGTGSVFAVVVYSSADSGGGGDAIVLASSAYVPILTYGCSPANNTDRCQLLPTAFPVPIFITLFIVGIFLMMFGQMYYKITFFACVVFTTGIISDYGLAFLNMPANSFRTLLSLASGVTWWKIFFVYGMRSPGMFPLLLMNLLVTGTFFHFSSGWLSAQSVVQSNVNYWLSLVSGSISLTALSILWRRKMKVLAYAIIGAYLTAIPFDYYVKSNIKYIIINMYRRATIEDFSSAVTDPPFQIRDFIVVLYWFGVSSIGYFLQSRLPNPHDTADYTSL